MTPKEKAKELVNKMIIDFIDWTYFIPIDKTNNSTIQTEAKRRALIAVDEIIESKTYRDTPEEYEYWYEVKEEINNL